MRTNSGNAVAVRDHRHPAVTLTGDHIDDRNPVIAIECSGELPAGDVDVPGAFEKCSVSNARTVIAAERIAQRYHAEARRVRLRCAITSPDPLLDAVLQSLALHSSFTQ